jgi:hypothetical protein
LPENGAAAAPLSPSDAKINVPLQWSPTLPAGDGPEEPRK